MVKRLDLIAVALSGWALLPFVYVVSVQPIQAVLGSLVVLFCPGYALLAALFPKGGELEALERVALSIGISVVLVALVGMALYLSPWPVGFSSAALCLAIVITGLSAIAALVRQRQQPDEFGATRPHLGRSLRATWVPSLLAVIAVLIVVGGVVYRVQKTPTGGRFTELYVLDSQGGTSYATALAVGRPEAFTVGVVNHEEQATAYRVRILLQGQVLNQIGPIQLGDKEGVELQVLVTATEPTERDRLEFRLFRSDEASPYKTAQFWVSVRAN